MSKSFQLMKCLSPRPGRAQDLSIEETFTDIHHRRWRVCYYFPKEGRRPAATMMCRERGSSAAYIRGEPGTNHRWKWWVHLSVKSVIAKGWADTLRGAQSQACSVLWNIH